MYFSHDCSLQVNLTGECLSYAVNRNSISHMLFLFTLYLCLQHDGSLKLQHPEKRSLDTPPDNKVYAQLILAVF